MLGNRKLFVNDHCEIKDLLLPYIDGTVGTFELENLVPDSIYILSWFNFIQDLDNIKTVAEGKQAIIFLSNPCEGSATIHWQISTTVKDLVLDKKILVISGGDIEPQFPHLVYEWFMTKILTFKENLEVAEKFSEIYEKNNKPYKFLFLNGELRPHRKYLIDRWTQNNLLEQSIWSSLSTHLTTDSTKLSYMVDGKNVLPIPRMPKYLDAKYEVDRYAANLNLILSDTRMKEKLFNNEWGEVYVKLEPYVDTYFSVVTETVFGYPYSFRTEKIWKPIAMAHPWIVVANQGYYRDMRNLGFRTFGHVIDESFDAISNNQDRIERIAMIVEDLCCQDLMSFLTECRSVCEYNQQHHRELAVKAHNEFPEKFIKFTQENGIVC